MESTKKLAAIWAEGLQQVLAEMGLDGARVSCSDAGGAAVEEGFAWWSHELSCVRGPAVWAGAPAECWNWVARAVLEGLGIDSAGDDELHGACKDLIAQVGSVLAAELSSRRPEPVTAGAVAIGQQRPEHEGHSITISLAGVEQRCFVVFAPGLSTATNPTNPEAHPAELPPAIAGIRLNAHVTLGRTTLTLKEICKLTVGSIVELGRLVTEPAELVANHRAVARGQIMVLHGDYALKVTAIEERPTA